VIDALSRCTPADLRRCYWAQLAIYPFVSIGAMPSGKEENAGISGGILTNTVNIDVLSNSV